MHLEFLTKKLEKKLELELRTLRNPGIWYLEKSGSPVYRIQL